MRLLYNTALGLVLLLAIPWLAYRLAQGKYRQIALARMGIGSAWLPESKSVNGIWVHALSVGEVRSALPLIAGLARAFPGLPVCLSSATDQGLAIAKQALAGSGHEVFVRPLDLPWAVERLLNRLRPRLFCLVEGDIWPKWQWSLARRGVPRMLVNNRVSPRTFRRYRRFAPLARELFAGFDKVLAQTGVDYQHLAALGVDGDRLVMGGNLKFDSAPPELDQAGRERLARELGLAGRVALAAGSTHPGEDEPVLEAFKALAADRPELTLILAPREIERGPGLARRAAGLGLSAHCLSQGPAPGGVRVLVLDVLGRLAGAYALCQAAFVGGSFVPVGGHNLLEPAAQGVPVLFGPITHNFAEMARQLEEVGGGLRLERPADLHAAWRGLLDDPERAGQMGDAAREFCHAHRGAVDRAVSQARALLEEGRDA